MQNNIPKNALSLPLIGLRKAYFEQVLLKIW